MRVAIIDLGTNTFNLLIAELDGESFQIIFSTKKSVKLGEGGITKKQIADAAYQRGIEALSHYHKIVIKKGVEKVFAFATSAIRSAENGAAFATEAESIIGAKINIIDGDREAELIFQGVKLAVKPDEKPFLIMDIGGGSTEFIIVENEKLIWKQSFNLGVARLLERFQPSDPILESDIEVICNYLDEKLKPLSDILGKIKVSRLIGSSGSFDTFAEMICNDFYTPSLIDKSSTFHFKLDEFEMIHKKLLASTLQERLCMKGLIPMRADMIVLASVFVKYMLTRFSITEMQLSKYALKEGVIYELMHQHQ
ncbi:MAG: Ppx/GppA phosphatase family protein [Bacteroidota bacterium]